MLFMLNNKYTLYILPYKEKEVVLCRRLCRGLRLGYGSEIRWGRASGVGPRVPGAVRHWVPGTAPQVPPTENRC